MMRKDLLSLCAMFIVAFFLVGCSASSTPTDARKNTSPESKYNTTVQSKPTTDQLVDILVGSNITYNGVDGFYHICNDVKYNFIQINKKEYLIFYFTCSVDHVGDSATIVLEKLGSEWKVYAESHGDVIPPEIYEGAEKIDLDKSLVIDYTKKTCYFSDKILKTHSDISDLIIATDDLQRELDNFDKIYKNINCAVTGQINNWSYEAIIPNNKNSYHKAKLIIYDGSIDRPGYVNVWIRYMYDEYNVKLNNGFTITMPVFTGYSKEGIISLKKRKSDELNTKMIELEKINSENRLGSIKYSSNKATSSVTTTRNISGIEILMQRMTLQNLSNSDLVGLSKWELDVLRNSVYARYGRTFNRQDLQEYFDSQFWYKPNPQYSDNMLSEVERYNATLIYNYQKELGQI